MHIMHVIAKKALREFWEKHPKAKVSLQDWWSTTTKAEWKTPQDIRNVYRTADFIADSRVIFNIGGNSYRLVVRVSYEYQRVMIKFVGTHAEYDKIDAETV